MMRMTPDVRTEMFAHALRGLPNEACGMFSIDGAAGRVDYFHPMRNAAESARLFRLDGQEMLDLEQAVERSGRTLVGVMHSHTNTSAYPSPTDVHDCANFDPSGTFLHVIVSVRDAEPVLRCFQITGDEIVELPVVVSDGDDDSQDQGGVAALAAVMPFPRAR